MCQQLCYFQPSLIFSAQEHRERREPAITVGFLSRMAYILMKSLYLLSLEIIRPLLFSNFDIHTYCIKKYL